MARKTYKFLDMGGNQDNSQEVPLPQIEYTPTPQKIHRIDTGDLSPDIEPSSELLESIAPQHPAPSHGPQVIRATTRGTVRVSEYGLVFRQPRDYYSVKTLEEQFGEEFWENEKIKRLMQIGALETVSESEADQKATAWEHDLAERQKKRGKPIIFDKDKLLNGW